MQWQIPRRWKKQFFQPENPALDVSQTQYVQQLYFYGDSFCSFYFVSGSKICFPSYQYPAPGHGKWIIQSIHELLMTLSSFINIGFQCTCITKIGKYRKWRKFFRVNTSISNFCTSILLVWQEHYSLFPGWFLFYQLQAGCRQMPVKPTGLWGSY